MRRASNGSRQADRVEQVTTVPDGASDFPTPRPRAWTVLLTLAAAVVALYFGTGANVVPLAAWLAAILALRFARSSTPIIGFMALWIFTIPVFATAWDFFPFGGTVGLAIFAVVAAMVNAVPFLFDRLVAVRLTGVWRTLPYPASATAIELAAGATGDLGSWGAVGYSQVQDLAMAQLVSVTGLGGLTFLIAWVAAAVNALWEPAQTPKMRRRAALPALIALALTIAFGQARLALSAPPATTIRASLIASPEATLFPDPASQAIWATGTPLSADLLQKLRAWNKPSNDAVLQSAERAAAAGSQIVAWGEAAVVVLDKDEAALTQRISEMALRHGILIAASMVVLPSDDVRRWDNKVLLFGPTGDPLWTYRKAVPTPGPERAQSLRGDAVMPVAEIGGVRIGGFICYDIDFPGLVAQASEQQADLLIVPSGDWPEVARLHANMAMMRAIEQGVTVVRPTTGGVSVAYDRMGRTIGRLDTVYDGIQTMTVWLPDQRTSTLYGAVGDLPAWLSAPLTLLLAAFARVEARRRRHEGV